MNTAEKLAPHRWKQIKRILFQAVVLLGLMGGQQALADVACRASTLYPPMTLTPNVSVSSSTAGEDLPVGATIYRMGVGYSKSVGIYCNAAFDVPITARITSTPGGAPKTMTTDRGTGSVYPTNVPGIGVAIYTPYPTSGSYALLGSSSVQLKYHYTLDSAGDNTTGVFQGGYNLIGMMLVKTGPIASGSVVNASTFPSFVVEAHAMPGYTGLPVAVLSGSFTGSNQFVTQTCTTPANMTINLGTYDVTAGFTAVGQTTKWIDSSVILQNCPAFSGYYGRGGADSPGAVDSGTATGGSRVSNILTISVTPTNSVSGNVIAVDSVNDAAKGVGIQLGFTPGDINASATAPSTIWSAGKNWNLTPSTAGGTVKIPLAARYYQTDSQITPGRANANIVVNISYK